MSRMLFDFMCKDGHSTEHFVDSDTRESTCKECGQPATREVSAPRTCLDPLSGDFPGATMSWAEKRNKQMRIERKAEENHGPDASKDVARRAGAD